MAGMLRFLLFPLLAALALTVSPASAIDDSKPAVACYGLAYTDKVGDNVRGHDAFEGEPGTDNLDLVSGFLKYDAAKGDDAMTINIGVKNLDKTIPEGSTSSQWQLDYTGAAGTAAWVRAVVDFAGLVTYDYGGVQDGGATTVNVRSGGTRGAFFEGPDGIVQIVIPPEVEPKGTTLKAMTVNTYEPAQAIPPAAPTPVKGGQLYPQDNAPVKGSHTIGSACPATAPAAPEPSTDAPKPGPVQSGDAALPVKVTSTKFKAKKVKKAMKVKLTSTEPVTQLAAQIKKGKKVFGKGSLAKLDGKGTIRLKVKGLKKGSYTLDLVGTDGSGARRFAVARIKVS